MAGETKLKKSIFRQDQQKYYWGQFTLNMGAVVSATVLSVWIFVAFGNGTGTLIEVQALVFLVILFCAVIQSWAVVTNTRQDYLRDRWYMKEEPRDGSELGYIPNPWRLILPRALVSGVIIATGAALVVPWLGQEPFHIFNISFICGIPLFAVSAILIILILPRDQEAYAAALARTRFSPVPFRRYIALEHFLPWLPIQGVINFTVGLKQFAHEAQKYGGSVPVHIVALDAGFVFALIFFLSWISSQVQVRPDVRLGRVIEDNKKAPAVALMLLLCFFCNCFGALAWVILRIFWGVEISPLSAACLKGFVVMVAVIPGCSFGVWWGNRRESSLMRKNP